MADISKLRRRSSLGPPPPPAEASPNLEAPEIAPAIPPHLEPGPKAPTASAPAAVGSAGEAGRIRRDARSARRTGRTLQFATRVSPEFDERLRVIAERDGLLLVEVLERALDAYEAAHRR